MIEIKKIIEKLAEDGFSCPYCEAKYEDDDFAYLQETGQCQYCHKNIDFIDYNDTPFQNKCRELIQEISTTFKNYGFTDAYLKYDKYNELDKLEVEDYIRGGLTNLDEFTKHDLNEMWSMLSCTNCWCVDYRVGQIVHEQLMKIWYPKDYIK